MHDNHALRTHRRLAGAWVGCAVLLGTAAVTASAMPVTTASATSSVQAQAAVRPGPVVTWGGPPELREKLRPPAVLQDAVAIAASDTRGSYSNLALRADGTVVGWGLNTFGEATPPEGLGDVTAIDTGAGFSMALRRDGSVVAWGSNASGQLDVPGDLGPVTAISAGGYLGYGGPGLPDPVCGFALALRADGTVVRWGHDNPGLGCSQLDKLDPPAGLDRVVAISAGSQQALALRADGTVVAWGTGSGVGPSFDGSSPDNWSDMVAISAGSGNSLGLRSDGTALAYGIWGESGAPRVTNVSALSASNVDVFLHTGGTIQLYRDTYPSSAPAAGGFQAVSAGYDYGLAIGPSTLPKSLLGSTQVQPEVDSNPSGSAEAFQYAADHTGTATSLHAYLDQTNEATEVIVGVYEDLRGQPGELLSSGRSSKLVAGSWNEIPIEPVEVREGQTYWLAVLSPRESGSIRFRALPDGQGGPTRLSKQIGLSSRAGLPPIWRTGRKFTNSPASLYLS